MSDLIDRRAAIEHLKKRLYETALNSITEHPYYEEIADNRVDVWMNELPSAQADSCEYYDTESHYCALYRPSAQTERNPGKTLAEEVERIKREITDIFAEQMGVQIEPLTDKVDDTISRQATMDEISKQQTYKMFYGEDTMYLDANDVASVLASMPSAERKGKWINHRNDSGHNIADCSVCGSAIQWFDDDEKPRFCCMCGADMRERREE